MKKSATLLLCFILFFLSTLRSKAQSLPQLGKNSIKEVIAAMTLEEKAHLVVGLGMNMSAMPASMKDTKLDTIHVDGISTGPVIGETMDKVSGAAGTTYAIPRLGIPGMVVADGPAGLRIQPIRNNDSSKTYYATAFPVATLLASTWDTALVSKVGAAFGDEVHEYGVDIILAPALNIHRNPLGGRNFEYYSEDPLIAGSMTAAMVNGIQQNGVGTSIKHYAANNEETDRNTINTIVSERALRELYLKGFRIAVERSQPWTVMSSYNKINGTYASENYDLLTNILRKEWHLKGFVMTDWFGGKDAIAQMKAGNDLLMPGRADQFNKIITAVKDGSLDVRILDENVAHILNVILLSPSFKKYKFSNSPDLKKHYEVSRNAAADGMVLLKNENAALPFKNVKNIIALGNTSYDFIAGGTGSGEVNKAYTVSLIQGLNNAGYVTNRILQNNYITYIKDAKAIRPKPKGLFAQPAPIAEMPLDETMLAQYATEADIALVTIGRNAGEGSDRKVENDFNLTEAEKMMLTNIANAFHAKNKKVVVILNICGVIETASWQNNADAILLAWQPGMEAGNAIADILSGKINPSGKLATTFPVTYNDVPSAKNFPGKEFPEQATIGNFGMKQTPAEVTYEEGIYVGYRYYNTFKVKPAYPFGYGLSYSKFTYSNLKLSSSTYNGSIKATITIVNNSEVAGKEAVEIYLSAPVKNMDKPAEELKAFAKTNLLEPGKSQTLTFTLYPSDLASFYTGKEAWIADAGTYTLKAGASSADIRLSASFTLDKDIMVEKVTKELAPAAVINEMK